MAVCEAFVMTHGDIYSKIVIGDLFIPSITCALYAGEARPNLFLDILHQP